MNVSIYGAEINAEIRLQLSHIQCFKVDQFSPSLLEDLHRQLPGPMDLIVDDGFRSFYAYLNNLQMVLKLIQPWGWIFVEGVYEPQAEFFLFLNLILHQLKIQSCPYAFDALGAIFGV